MSKKSRTSASLLRETATREELEVLDRLDRRIRGRMVVKRLIGLRVAKGLSQAEMAAELKCTQSRISKLESGMDEDLRLGDIESYLGALGLTHRLLVTPRANTIVDSIKYHWSCLANLLGKLQELAQSDAEISDRPKIAEAIGKFSVDVAFNFTSIILNFIQKLPAAARQEASCIGIEVQEMAGDDDLLVVTEESTDASAATS